MIERLNKILRKLGKPPKLTDANAQSVLALINSVYANISTRDASGSSGDAKESPRFRQHSPSTADNSHWLEEKERRLQMREELASWKERAWTYQEENERLRRGQTARGSGYSAATDSAREENIELKLRVAELESELSDEKIQNKSRVDATLDALKAQAASQYLDSKVKFEEQLLSLKEQIFNLKVENASLTEQNQVVRDTLNSRNDKIADLEAENVRMAKENIYLNSELDQEVQRNVQ